MFVAMATAVQNYKLKYLHLVLLSAPLANKFLLHSTHVSARHY